VKLGNFFRNMDLAAAAMALIVLVALTITLVSLREIFGIAVPGSDEFSQYLLLCIVFLGLPAVARTGGHIKMEEFLSILPRRIQVGIRILMAICAFAAFLIISYSALRNVIENLGTVTPSLQMPFSIYLAPTVLGFFLVAIEYVIVVVRLVALRSLAMDDKTETAAGPESGTGSGQLPTDLEER